MICHPPQFWGNMCLLHYYVKLSPSRKPLIRVGGKGEQATRLPVFCVNLPTDPFLNPLYCQSSAAVSSHVLEKSKAFMYKFWTLRNHLNMSVAY